MAREALGLHHAVHLHEELVDDAGPQAPSRAEEALDPPHEARSLRGGGGRAGAAGPDGVDLVDEDHGAVVLLHELLGLAEQGHHPEVADAHEHVGETRGRRVDEGHPHLAGDRLTEQGLAGARRTLEEDAVGREAPDLLELLEPTEELDDLFHRVDDGTLAPYVAEGDVVLVRIDDVGAAPGHQPEHPSHLHEQRSAEDHHQEHRAVGKRRDPVAERHVGVVRQVDAWDRNARRMRPDRREVDPDEDEDPGKPDPNAVFPGHEQTQSLRGRLRDGRHDPQTSQGTAHHDTASPLFGLLGDDLEADSRL